MDELGNPVIHTNTIENTGIINVGSVYEITHMHNQSTGTVTINKMTVGTVENHGLIQASDAAGGVVSANSTQNAGTITQSGAVPGSSLVADSISNDGVINFGSPVVEPPVVEPPVVEPPVVEPPVVEPPQGTTKASVQVVFDDSKSGVTASGLTLQVGVGEQPGQLSNAKLNIE